MTAAASRPAPYNVAVLYRDGAAVIIHITSDPARERAVETRARIVRRGGRVVEADPRPLLELAPEQVAIAARRILSAGGVVLDTADISVALAGPTRAAA